MKKLLLTGAIFLMGVVTCNAQEFGLKGGLNVSNVSNMEEAKSKAGFYVGAFVKKQLTDQISIQPELLLNMKGAKGNDGDTSTRLNLTYISLPVMVQYYAAPQFYLEAGPEIGLLLSSKIKAEGSSLDMGEFFKTFDFGLGIGAGYNFSDKFGANIRYVAGLANIAKENDGNALKNGAFQIGLTYKITK